MECGRDAAARTAVEGEEDEETEDEREREVGEGITVTVTGGVGVVWRLAFEGLRPVIGCAISGVTEPAAQAFFLFFRRYPLSLS